MTSFVTEGTRTDARKSEVQNGDNAQWWPRVQNCSKTRSQLPTKTWPFISVVNGTLHSWGRYECPENLYIEPKTVHQIYSGAFYFQEKYPISSGVNKPPSNTGWLDVHTKWMVSYFTVLFALTIIDCGRMITANYMGDSSKRRKHAHEESHWSVRGIRFFVSYHVTRNIFPVTQELRNIKMLAYIAVSIFWTKQHQSVNLKIKILVLCGPISVFSLATWYEHKVNEINTPVRRFVI